MFQSLHPHDQRHLLAVYQKTGDAGLSDSVRQAALLHDIGKVTLCGTRISLAARIIHVILQRTSPSTDRALAELNLPGLGVGLRLANHHGKLGADRLRALGVSCRVCEIVEIHDDKNQHDGDVRLLQEIDSATP